MRYTNWVAQVLHALARASASNYGGVGLAQIGQELGAEGLIREDFVQLEGMPAALMTAMYDLEAMGLVEFENVDFGNKLSTAGRDSVAAGLSSTWPAIADIPMSNTERVFMARLYQSSAIEDSQWADLAFTDADVIYRDSGLEAPEAYHTTIQRLTFLGDLERKGLIRPESRTLGGPNNYRPTYWAAVLIAEPDARDRAIVGGVIDWSVPTPGFDAIGDRLADLKVLLAAARTDDELSDVGRRCRDIAADAVDVVFRHNMVRPDETAPSRQDAEVRLRLYLRARASGDDFEELRAFLRAALKLASARTHSARTGRAAAIASAQGLISFVRALEAIERSPSVRDTEGVQPRNMK